MKTESDSLSVKKARSTPGWAFFLLIAILLANAYALRHELSSARVDLNDNVFHYTLIEHTVQAVESRQNPLDFWVPEWSFGYPVFRTYQPLAHWFVAALYFAMGKTVPLMTLFVWVRYLLLVLLPLSFFTSARLLSLPPPAAVAAALLAPLIATQGLYGLEAESFVWAGLGLFTQLFATHLLLLGIGLSFQALRTGKGLTFAGAVLGLTFLGHMIYGYVGLITTLLMAAMLLPEAREHAERIRVGGRVLWIWVASGCIAGFHLFSLLADRGITNHSHWEPTWKWDSFGPAAVFHQLFTGGVLDYGRLPVLSILALLGVAAGVWFLTGRGPAESAIAPMASWSLLTAAALFWTLLYCGRPLWGRALLLAGITSDFQLHRLIGAVQIFLIFLGGAGLAQLWKWIGSRKLIWSGLVTILILTPAVRERRATLKTEAQWGQQNLDAFAYAEPTLETAIQKAKDRGNRVYAGLGGNWGAQWKVGYVPFYAFLGPQEVPAVSYLYHTLSLAGDFVPRFDENVPAFYQLFNVGTLAAAQADLVFVQPAGAFGGFRLWSTPTDGYFDLVDVPYAAAVNRSTFFEVNDRWLHSLWIFEHAHLALDLRAPVPNTIPMLPPGPLPRLPPPQERGSVENQRVQGAVYSAEVRALRPTYVLFKMSWHPNWKVYLDGTLTPTVMLSPGFIGVPVTAGTHRILCRYESGMASPLLAGVGLLLALAMKLAERKLISSRLSSAASPSFMP